MFACRDATELVTEEREGALSGGKRFLYRLHMLVCGPCRAYRRQMEQTIDLAKQIPRDEPARDVEDRLAEAFRVSRRGEAPRR